MHIIRFAIENPVKIAVGVILLVLFGLIVVFRIPIQLTPDVDKPRVTVTTSWPGASVQEIEREIVERQEEKLKSVSNLRKMTSTSEEGQAEVGLEFYVGVDKDDALRDVSEALRQVSGYPDEVDEPVTQAADAALEAPIAWLIFRGGKEDASTLRDYVDKTVKPLLERVDGVASVDIYGGREREVQIRVNARELAARGLTFRDLERALRGQNETVTAGTLTQGKRDYTYRTVGKFERIEDVESTVVTYRSGGPVYVRDVARVTLGFEKQRSFVNSKGDYVLALPVRRETGANVMDVMQDLRARIAEINRDFLKPRGEGWSLTQVYDETEYIESAIGLVHSNIYWGGALTVLVLLLFLRSGTATLVLAITIPISIIGTFLAVKLLGRSLNVVMLAGLAFAVGMVLDNAVVVVENIFRHRQSGATLFDAALKGTHEVWGAVLARTLTTLVVFIPVVFVEEEAGQLFRDIALAISASAVLSLFVAVLVIPPLANKLLHIREGHLRGESDSGSFAGWMSRCVHRINGSVAARLATVLGLTSASLAGAWFLMPPIDYLPSGNRNLIFGAMLTPPGYSLDEFRRMGQVILDGTPEQPYGIRQFWAPEPGSAEAAKLPPVKMPIAGDRNRLVEVVPPPIDNFFYVSFGGGCFMGCTSKDEVVVRPLAPVMSRAAGLIEGSFAFFRQSSLFSGIRGGNTLDLEVLGDDLGEVTKVATALSARLMRDFGFPEPTPPNFDRPREEVRIIPSREKAAQLGLTTSDAAFILASMVDGAYVGGFRDRGDEIDMALIVEHDATTPEAVAQLPVYTPSGQIVPLSGFVDLVRDTAPQRIQHIEEFPAVRLSITATESMPLETVMRRVEEEIIEPARASGAIPPTVITRLAGNAEKLKDTFDSVKWNLLLALFITYLLMCALFESFLQPLVIMFSVPPATVGGFAMLSLVHWLTERNPLIPTQQLDVLTMLGFIILIGIVVDNATLVVHQAMHNMKGGMAPREAISESVRTRIRPVFMTAFSTIVGTLPLVIMPGAGSELYRGLGAVMLGGLLVATLFTLLLVPALFSLLVDAEGWLRGAWARFRAPAALADVPGLAPAASSARVESAPRSRSGASGPAPSRHLEPAELTGMPMGRSAPAVRVDPDSSRLAMPGD